MNHLKGFNQLNRTHSHRKALYKNMAEALFKNERIMTTKQKAKEIRRIAEKMITKAKERNLHNIRIINKMIKNKVILMKLFDEIAPRYQKRKGGYTRIIKLKRRKGDGACMAYLELIEEVEVQKKKVKPKKVVVKDNKQETSKPETIQPEEKIKTKPTKKVDIKETKKLEKADVSEKINEEIKEKEKDEVVTIVKEKKVKEEKKDKIEKKEKKEEKKEKKEKK